MSQFVRAFLAFDIEDFSIKKKLNEMQKIGVQTGADLKLVESDNIHITIRFLGDISLSMADNIFFEIQQVQFERIQVQLGGLGIFPSLSYPRVLWVGITFGVEQLQDIFRQIETRLQKMGFPPDEKGFSPHLTIARVHSARNKQFLVNFVTKNAKYNFGFFQVECLRLKRSDLTPKGPIYTTLKEHCPKLDYKRIRP